MKFMGTWRLRPENHRSAAERFLATGAAPPDGVTILGRWHAPGSVSGFTLYDVSDMTAFSAHVGEWSDLLDLDVTPVLEDAEAGAAAKTVMGG